MKIGADLSVTSAPHRLRGGSGPAWDPSAAFAQGAQGAWFDPSDLATLFQDAAMSQPVTSAGQPVGAMLDKSGHGKHATQAINEARPTYRTDGVRHWLEFDGVDDRMQMVEAVNLNAGTVFLSLNEPEGTGIRILISGATSGYICVTGSGAARGVAKNQGGAQRLIDTPATFSMAPQRAVGLRIDGGNLLARRAGEMVLHSNSTAGAAGLNAARHLMAFSQNGELPPRVDFFGALMLEDAVTGAAFDMALAFMDQRIAA